MTTMRERLIDELQERGRFASCSCGGVAYPRCWMTKTREKAVKDGAIRECECTDPNGVNVMLKVC